MLFLFRGRYGAAIKAAAGFLKRGVFMRKPISMATPSFLMAAADLNWGLSLTRIEFAERRRV